MSLADLQIAAIRGVLEELLSNSGTGDPRTFAFNAIGQIGAILDMESEYAVVSLLCDQEERRASEA